MLASFPDATFADCSSHEHATRLRALNLKLQLIEHELPDAIGDEQVFSCNRAQSALHKPSSMRTSPFEGVMVSAAHGFGEQVRPDGASGAGGGRSSQV